MLPGCSALPESILAAQRLRGRQAAGQAAVGSRRARRRPGQRAGSGWATHALGPQGPVTSMQRNSHPSRTDWQAGGVAQQAHGVPGCWAEGRPARRHRASQSNFFRLTGRHPSCSHRAHPPPGPEPRPAQSRPPPPPAGAPCPAAAQAACGMRLARPSGAAAARARQSIGFPGHQLLAPRIQRASSRQAKWPRPTGTRPPVAAPPAAPPPQTRACCPRALLLLLRCGTAARCGLLRRPALAAGGV